MQSKSAAVALKSVPGVTPAIVAAATREGYWVYARGYRIAWWSIVPLVVLAMLCLFFMRNVREQMTETVEATVERVEGKDEKSP